jgi:Fic family protein
MEAADFAAHAPGRLVAVPGGTAFVPAALPRGVPLPPATMRSLGEARGLLGRLREGIRTLPGPELFLRPFQTREAVLSSRIEGTRTTLEDAFINAATADDGELVDDDREVDNYARALQAGSAALLEGRPLTTGLVKGLHRELLRSVRGDAKQPGEYRDVQVIIGPPGSGGDLRLARFVPPPPLELAACLEDLDAYLANRESDEPLVRVALAHYQFETIHPFADGNGRAGRLLLILQMVWEGILDRPCLYLSPFFERRRQEYYDRLLRVSTQGALLAWLDFFVEGVIASTSDTLDRLHRLRLLQQDFVARLRKSQTQKPAQLVEQLFSLPFLTVPMAKRVLQVPQSPTAQQAIDKLVAAGILELTDYRPKQGRGRPPKLYRCPAILDIMRE